MIQTAQKLVHSFRRILAASNYRPSHRIELIQLKFMRSFMDDARRNRLHLIHKSTDQRVLAGQVCNAWNAARVLINSFHSLRGKNGSSVNATDTQSFVYVPGHFFVRERLRSASHGDALAQLAKPRIAQLFLELRLAGKHNLQQLFACRLEIGEQTNLLQDFEGKILRFINDQDRGLAIAIPLQQPVIESHQHVAFVPALAGYSEVRHHEVEELIGVELRVENVGGSHAFQV